MAQKDLESVLGDDPLAWMKEDDGGDLEEPDEVEAEESEGSAELPVEEEPLGPDDSADLPTIVLMEDMTLASISDAHIQLLSHLDGNDQLTLDGSCVAVIDTAGVQMLASFCRSLNHRNVEFNWHSPSTELKRIAALMDLEGPIGIKD